MKLFGILFFLIVFFYPSIHAHAVSNDKTREDIKQLEQRIKKLESGRKNSQLNNISTATGLSRSFNPAISLHGLLLGTYNSEGNDNSSQSNKTGLSVEELELQLAGNVDTWFRVQSTFSMEGTSQFGLEELVGSGLITNNLSLQVGKLFVPIGKHNQLHTHSQPFVATPVSNEMVLGEDGLKEIGFGASYLLPFSFFSEINLQILEGENEDLFASTVNDGFAYLTKSANSFDLSDETTMDVNLASHTHQVPHMGLPHNEPVIKQIRVKVAPIGATAALTMKLKGVLNASPMMLYTVIIKKVNKASQAEGT